jgi:hypothetical protein
MKVCPTVGLVLAGAIFLGASAEDLVFQRQTSRATALASIPDEDTTRALRASKFRENEQNYSNLPGLLVAESETSTCLS